MKVVLLITLFWTGSLWAEGLDSANQEGLQKTQELLKSRSERDKFIKTDSKAQKVDQQVKDLAPNPKQQDAMYGVSSEIFGDMVEKTGGDDKKQMELLEKASQNPEQFYRELSPDQQKQIRGIAEEIERSNPRGPLN